MTRRLIAIDLDGTLFNTRGQVSERTAAALRAAHDAGIVVAPATARWYQAAMRPFEALGLEVAAIASAGADVRLPGGQVVEQHPLDPEFVGFFAGLCDRADWVVNVSTPARAYRRASELPAWAANAPEWLRPVTSLRDADLTSALAVLAEMSTDNEHWPLLEPWSGRVSFYPAVAFNGDALLTITARDVDKGTGLLALCRSLGVNPADAVAIGDSEVDVPMFRVAGLSFAMADGMDEAKAAATRLTATADADGVAAVIEGILAGG